MTPVDNREAKSLATALAAALPDIPSFSAHDEAEELDADEFVRNVFHWWSSDMRENLERVWIPFFRQGGFEIVEEPPFEIDETDLPFLPGADSLGEDTKNEEPGPGSVP